MLTMPARALLGEEIARLAIGISATALPPTERPPHECLMIPNSAFISVGEPKEKIEQARAGKIPSAELVSMLDAGTFGRVLTMSDRGMDASSLRVCARFAAQAYRQTWDATNLYLGEEFPGIQYLALHAALGRLPRRRRRRVVMLIHNVASMKRRLMLSPLAWAADRLLCLSERSKADLVSRYGVPASRVSVVGSRVDTRYFQPAPEAPQRLQICSAGAINRDYDTLIEAGRGLGVPVKIAADTAWGYSMGGKSLPGSGALPDHVEMRSWGTYEKLRALYAESRVIVVPLARELMSGVTVALEGMAMGKPVILTHNPYVEDFLEEGVSGLFVRAGDPQALRAKIRHLLDHPGEAERLGARARQWVAERFSVEAYVRRIVSAFA